MAERREFQTFDAQLAAAYRALRECQNYGGPPELRIATGRARCRVCGERIAKGEQCVYVVHDFQGSGSFTAIACYLHAHDCSEKAHV